MLFNSISFVIFFPIVTILYFLLPYKYRWLLLLLASCFFYMFFKPIYILILFFTIIIDYFAGILIENAEGARRKFYLSWSLVANIGVLAIFKYYNFLNGNITSVVESLGGVNPIPYLNILLPIGLSFHTFQAMSYTIEVYRGNFPAERNFGMYALYVMFYPQLVAGPIERPQHILPQFYEKHDFSYERVVSGLRLMLLGFLKKVVIADRMALVVNQVFTHRADQNGLTYLIGMYCFTFQMYCDFSGYSDIARGCARVMGYELMVNFNMPYISRSLQELWTRWHISLTSWFRDYLYIPLGGSKVSYKRYLTNIMLVWLLSGLWHGARWTYVMWGGLHGFFLVMSVVMRGKKKVAPNPNPAWFMNLWNWFTTFHLFLIALVFIIPAITWQQGAETIYKMIVNTPVTVLQMLHHNPMLNGLGKFDTFTIGLMFMGMILLTAGEYIWSLPAMREQFYKRQALRYAVYFILFYTIIFLGYFGETQFIYFQF